MTGDITYKPVEATIQKERDVIYNIVINGEELKVSDNHPFWVENEQEWIASKDLLVGDILQTSDGQFLPINDIIVEERKATVYNLTVADYHTYFVSELGLWVHNTNNNCQRAYQNVDTSKMDQIYVARDEFVVQMPYNGKGKRNSNAQGWLRDSKYFWNELLERKPEAFSKSNRYAIENGLSPVNDATFRKYYPEYDRKDLYQKTLIHHHIGNGGEAMPIPAPLHPGYGGVHMIEKENNITGYDYENSIRLETFLKGE